MIWNTSTFPRLWNALTVSQPVNERYPGNDLHVLAPIRSTILETSKYLDEHGGRYGGRYKTLEGQAQYQDICFFWYNYYRNKLWSPSRHELHALVTWCPLILEMSRDHSEWKKFNNFGWQTGRLLCHRWPRASTLIICLHTFPSAIPSSQRLSMPACSVNCTGIFAIVWPGDLLGGLRN